MAASCLWQVGAINLDQLNVDADDNELGGGSSTVGPLRKSINQSSTKDSCSTWMQRYIDA